MNPEIQEISAPSQPLPEQAKSVASNIHNDLALNIMDILTHWQPMGMRVVIKLNFISDDLRPLFAIRVSPFIPLPKQYANSGSDMHPAMLDNVVYPLPGDKYSQPTDAVQVVVYDLPPPLAAMAASHRFWAGGMRYRMRCVSNFITSGYVIAGVIKGSRATICSAVTNNLDQLQKQYRVIDHLYAGYRGPMMNSYVMSDTSMFRHLEVDVPYEYPFKFYDEARAMAERQLGAYTDNDYTYEQSQPDNFVVISNRGSITSPTEGAELVYELEYAAMPDMQFSTWCLAPPVYFTHSNEHTTEYGLPLVYPLAATMRKESTV